MHILHSWGPPLKSYMNFVCVCVCVCETWLCKWEKSVVDECSTELGHGKILEEITELTTAAVYVCGCVIVI